MSQSECNSNKSHTAHLPAKVKEMSQKDIQGLSRFLTISSAKTRDNIEDTMGDDFEQIEQVMDEMGSYQDVYSKSYTFAQNRPPRRARAERKKTLTMTQMFPMRKIETALTGIQEFNEQPEEKSVEVDL